MKIKAWGTRGSIAVSNPKSVYAGGNTTCYEVMSSCFPVNIRVMLDSGTGFVPAGWHYMTLPNAASIKYYIFYTHWHWDHILGLTLSPPTFINQIPMYLFGPHDAGVGPKDMVQYVFKRPFFPVDSGKFIHKMSFKTLYDYDVHVIVAHPEAGFTTLKLDRFNTLSSGKKQIAMNGKNSVLPMRRCPSKTVDIVRRRMAS
jgi:phosphoribosyl 1,2-cyclic phosphodiesterase